MKKVKTMISLMISIAMVISLIFVSSYTMAATTIIDDFEEGGTNLAGGYWPIGWAPEFDTTVYKSGTRSTKLVKDNANQWPEYMAGAADIGLETSGKANFDLWVKTAGTGITGSFSFRILITDSNDKRWYNDVPVDVQASETDFVLVSGLFNDFKDYPAGTEYYNFTNESTMIKTFDFILIGTPATTFTMWIDDIALSGDAVAPTATSAPTPTADPTPVPLVVSLIDDFEDGGTNLAGGYWPVGWTPEIDTTVYKNGTRSIKLVKDNANQWPEYMAGAADIGLESSGKANFEVWVKTAGTGITGSFSFRIIFTDSNDKRWFNDVPVDVQASEADFVLARGLFTDFKSYPAGETFYNPNFESTMIKTFDFVLVGTPATTFTMWLDDIGLSGNAVDPTPTTAPTGEPTAVVTTEPTIAPTVAPPALDETGVRTYLQNFDNITDLESTGFKIENPSVGVVSLETGLENVKDGTASLKITKSSNMGYSGVNCIWANMGDIDLVGFTHLEAWIKMSATDIKGPVSVRTRLNIDTIWFATETIIEKLNAEEDFIQIRIPLSSLWNGYNFFDPEFDVTLPWMYQIDFDTQLEPMEFWIDGIALVNAEEVEEPTTAPTQGEEPTAEATPTEGSGETSEDGSPQTNDNSQTGFLFILFAAIILVAMTMSKRHYISE
ncbi:MAG: hypothetical protein ACYCYM_01440 [Saccharofermentanales bacterium]